MEIDKSILAEAIKKWGVEAQLNVVIEECLELALALQKLKRSGGDLQEKTLSAIDEIADVRIMVEQAIMMFDDPNQVIQKRIDYKINRIKQRLEK